ncbi:DUF4102 domain-containing protein [Pseudolysobacter antarcticus]|uniref:DUF4102 domain-containing protein n=1 Tax=Pseudolysobacter antarcticus TaxID=2511995 RepID=A0A411HNR3_9GAMM|nr:tyrosine-type recombinase/integrase [Pseudolysobacter antarcticus]QBB72106.1 DUF4102 domain-containing protein [Pseudolysobacter antarcticus]
MPKLTEKLIKSLKQKQKPYKVPDGDGLSLLVTAKNAKLWVWRFRFAGSENMLGLGPHPEVSLAEAREKSQFLRAAKRRNENPAEVWRRERGVGATSSSKRFRDVADEFLQKQSKGWTVLYLNKLVERLTKHVYPLLGNAPIDQIGVAQVLSVVNPVSAAGHLEQARRVLMLMAKIFRYAIMMEYATRNPAAGMRDAIAVSEPRHYASIIDPVGIGRLMRAIDGLESSLVTRCALKLIALTFARPGEVRGARWSEFDLKTGRWEIPASRRKLKKSAKENPKTPPHIVPLSAQSLLVLEELTAVTGSSEYLFPSVRSLGRSMSDGTLNGALRILGFNKSQMTAHGFRHMASTILNGDGFRPDAIERQLSHSGEGVRKIYNQADYIEERTEMMQYWANKLDEFRRIEH